MVENCTCGALMKMDVLVLGTLLLHSLVVEFVGWSSYPYDFSFSIFYIVMYFSFLLMSVLQMLLIHLKELKDHF